MRIEDGNVRLEDNKELSFGTNDNAKLYWDGNTLVGLSTISGVGTIPFTQLIDAPTSYTGEAGKSVVVNQTEDGLEFTTISGGVVGEAGGFDPDTDTITDKLLFDNNSYVDFNSGDISGNNYSRQYYCSRGTLVSGTGQGEVVFWSLLDTGNPPASGTLVSLDSNRKLIPTDFVNYPDRPCIGVYLDFPATFPDGTSNTSQGAVLIRGGGYFQAVNSSTVRGKEAYVDPVNPGVYTITKPTTPGQIIQNIGYYSGNNYSLWFETDYKLETVGEKLPANWRFEANGNDLELRFNDGDSWNLITTFSGTTE